MKRKPIVSNQCVSCGTCVKICPKDAISILDGIKAVVDYTKCIGCSLCCKTCPADVITMEV